MEKEVTKIKIPPQAKIKVLWSDRPENYSRGSRNRIQKYFAKKYDVDRNSINVVYKPIKVGKNGDVIEINGSGIENIMDTAYQRELFKEWLKREEKNVDFKRLVALDNKVNGELNIDLDETLHTKWKFNWLMINNLLSFGEGNYFPIDRFKGLTVVNSFPENMGGKTILTIDAMKFLLFGKTTKTDKNEEVFNQYSKNNELSVRGMMHIEGQDEFIIERHMKRSPKKDGGWIVKNSLNFYKILPDGEEVLMNDEDATQTTKKIKANIGTEKDFELVVLATARNLDDLLDFSSSESGKLLTRFIGLEVIEMKEQVVRKMYNEFSKTMKSNIYDIITLGEEVETHKANITKLGELTAELTTKFDREKSTISLLNDKKTKLLESKIRVDDEVLTLNPSKLKGEIEAIKTKGIGLKAKVADLNIEIDKIGVIEFDEDKYHQLTTDKTELATKIGIKKAEIVRLGTVIDGLVAGGICQSCNRALDDIDNTAHIKEHESNVASIRNELTIMERKEATLKASISELEVNKVLIDDKNKLELNRDKIEVDMGSLRNDMRDKKNDLKNYDLNIEAIELNRDVDTKVSLIDTKIEVCSHQKSELSNKMNLVSIDIETNTRDISTKEELIESINKEKEIDKIYKLYIEMVGRKGIGKLVLRSVLPIINSELYRLLDGVTEFGVEVFIDDKNEVRYLLLKDGVEKLLKSGSGFERTAASIALRCVLGKMSNLPMPNFITFDEVLGRVGSENFEPMKLLFDKVRDMFDIVFLITHNTLVKDWADNIITVNKENNISRISIK
jgi:hypothetical protein